MRARLLLVVLVLSAATVRVARATETQAEGGPGGNPFNFTCSDGRFLIGLAGASGSWIDQIRPVCGAWSANTHRFENVETGAPFGASPGSSDWERHCPRAYTISSLSIAPTRDDEGANQFVDDILIGCVTVEPPTEMIGLEQDSVSHPKSRLTPFSTAECPDGEVAVGIHGRAGQFVDALGLVCGPAPLAPGTVRPGHQPTTIERPSRPDSHVGQVLGDTTCLPGFVPRLAGPSDDVCVPPESHARVIQENATAASRRDPKGRFGPDSCITGYVWRGAFAGDTVCVTPQIRDVVREENALDSTRSNSATQIMRP